MNTKKLIALVFSILLFHTVTAQTSYSPLPRDGAVIDAGKARFTVLTPEMIRIQYSQYSQFEERATFGIVNRDLPVPEYTTWQDDTYLYIKTSALELRYRKESRISPAQKSPNNLQIALDVNGIKEIWYPGKDDSQNLLGTMRTLDNVPGDTHRGDMEKGLLSRSGWSVIDQGPAAVNGDGSKVFAFEPQEDGTDWVAPLIENNNSAFDCYFLGYGHNYKKAIADYTKVGGRIPLPPKYMFGYWYSRYWAYTQREFMNIVSEIERNDIPLDIMIMDMDWHKRGWTGWSWNKSLIPTPATLIRYMHNHGLKVALNLHPADGVGTHEDQYNALKNELGDKAQLAPDGAILWTVENRDFTKALFNKVLRPLESDGVDFWWLDWQQQKTVGGHANERGYTCPPGLEGLGETFWCNHVFYNDMANNRPDRRPIIYHRWGGLGSHRYPIGFSGDTYPTWATLQWQPYFTSTASNVGWTYWGHDLGGHQYDPDCNNPERYLRWMQFGVFTPIFRTHATNDGRIERRIWKFANKDKLRETVVLRYALFPYIYTAARQTYDEGIGMNRPLYYDYPEANNAYRFEDEYMFGDNILVAPITTPATGNQLSQRTTWLPEGAWWDVAKNRLVEGNATFTDRYTLDEIPYFYKAGSVIVNYPYQRTVMTTPETIILKVSPGGTGTGSFYEDSGDNADYDSKYAMTRYKHTGTTTRAVLEIGAREGQFDGMPEKRTYQVEFLGAEGEATNVTVDGKAAEHKYDAEKKTITVNVVMESLQTVRQIIVDAPFCRAEVLDNEYLQATVTAEANPKYWAVGSAVPGGIQPLTNFPDGKYKYHGSLNPGELYIIDTDGEQAGTRYYAPQRLYTNIVTDGMTYSPKSAKTSSAWNVTFAADNYSITFDTSNKTLSGKTDTWLLEMYIGGGCVADKQEDKWHTELFQLMENNPDDRNIWTWVGELKNRAQNVESNRFKLMAQKDWGPRSFHPFKSDEDVLTSTQVRSGGDDTKWTVSKDGFYRIIVDVFHETIRAEYLGTSLPAGITATETPLVGIEKIYDTNGMRRSELRRGVNIVKDGNGRTAKIIKR